MAKDQPLVKKTKGAKERLLARIAALNNLTCQILETRVDGLSAKYEEQIASDTDIAMPAVADPIGRIKKPIAGS